MKDEYPFTEDNIPLADEKAVGRVEVVQNPNAPIASSLLDPQRPYLPDAITTRPLCSQLEKDKGFGRIP